MRVYVCAEVCVCALLRACVCVAIHRNLNVMCLHVCMHVQVYTNICICK